MIKITDWECADHDEKIDFVDAIESVDFAYDGGRFCLYVNGCLVLSTTLSHDFSISVDSKVTDRLDQNGGWQ